MLNPEYVQVTGFRTEVEAYSPSRGTWRSLAPVPDARGDMALAAMPGNRLLIMGGETHAEGDRTQVRQHSGSGTTTAREAWLETHGRQYAC